MKHLFIIALIAITAGAQEKQKEPLEPRVSKLVQLKHLTGADFTHAIHMMRMFGVSIEGDQTMRAVAVSGSKAGVEAVEEALKRLDVPPTQPQNKNIEATLHVVLGSHKDGDAKLIPDVEGVIKQMRGLFQFQSYRMLETMLIRTRENREMRGDPTRFGGRMMADNVSPMLNCFGTVYASSSEDAKGRSFRLDKFSFKCDTAQGPIVNIYTDVDLREGQKAVVGKSSLDANSAIFLIVSAKQVE